MSNELGVDGVNSLLPAQVVAGGFGVSFSIEWHGCPFTALFGASPVAVDGDLDGGGML